MAEASNHINGDVHAKVVQVGVVHGDVNIYNNGQPVDPPEPLKIIASSQRLGLHPPKRPHPVKPVIVRKPIELRAGANSRPRYVRVRRWAHSMTGLITILLVPLILFVIAYVVVSSRPATKTDSMTPPQATQPAASMASPTVTATVTTSVAPPTVYDNGQGELNGNAYYDFDDPIGGGQSYAWYGDITFDLAATSLTGAHGALVNLATHGDTERDDCANVPPSSWQSSLSFDQLHVGTQLCVQTDQGRLAYLRITRMPDPNDFMGDELAFQYVVWSN